MHGSLNGDTWPLVYPAGFLYVYSAIQNLTGGQVFPAQVLPCSGTLELPLCMWFSCGPMVLKFVSFMLQILFGLVYIANLAIVLFIHLNTHVV